MDDIISNKCRFHPHFDDLMIIKIDNQNVHTMETTPTKGAHSHGAATNYNYLIFNVRDPVPLWLHVCSQVHPFRNVCAPGYEYLCRWSQQKFDLMPYSEGCLGKGVDIPI